MASSSMVIQPQLQIVAQQQKFGSQSFIHSMATLLGLQLLEYLPMEQQHKKQSQKKKKTKKWNGGSCTQKTWEFAPNFV